MTELLIIGVMLAALLLAGPTLFSDYKKRHAHH